MRQPQNVTIQTFVNWFGILAKPVDVLTAESRSNTCVHCPMMGRRAPANDANQKLEQVLHDLDLKTPMDDHLGACTIGLFDCRLKIWSSKNNEVLEKYPDNCWLKQP